MQAFFVLGLIPGTNIQINFYFWLGLTTLIIIYFTYHYISYLKYIRFFIRDLYLRKPLPAAKLHTRLK
jgi:hypothetical protein